ncbi:MAG TPA: UDP-N-acetylmuramoyl-L-alanine--D-glutamate ligase [Pirellulales bacterium]|jgi:UDP-N-acetylmuramoylalanine--D-glutamate ligase
MKLTGRKVTIMGLGRHGGGVAASRYCALAGAVVTVTDLASERELAESLDELSDVPIAKFTLGRHDAADFRAAEIVVVNPAVKPTNELVELARQTGAQITSEIELFLEDCPANVIGVTGTVGKSTTAAMLAGILQAACHRTWLGGNIGHSLLGDLPQMQPEDFVVLELSSFQLFWLSETARWPRAAIVTNCTPNHLEWHGTWEHYAAAKQRLLEHLPADGWAVLNLSDLAVADWRNSCRASIHDFVPLDSIPPLAIPGKHNRTNAAAASAMAQALGIDESHIAKALQNFASLPHRLQLIGEIAGRKFFNDSKSTTLASTIAALKAMEAPTWLLLGGALRSHEQSDDFRRLVAEIVSRCRGLALFGSAAALLEEALRTVPNRSAPTAIPNFRCETLEQALRWCWTQSRRGDTILLSPGFPSTDQFRDFQHRGGEFARLVGLLEDG